jgi:hypothetical protein
MDRAKKAFEELLGRSQEGLAFVYHRKPHGRDVLRAFHPDVFLSVVIQVLANEDDVYGWPLVLDVGKNRYRELVPVDVPWLHAMQLMQARLAFPLSAAPQTFTFRYLSKAEERSMIIADPLPAELAAPLRAPRPPRKRKDAQNCYLQPFAIEYMPANALADQTTCLLDTDVETGA